MTTPSNAAGPNGADSGTSANDTPLPASFTATVVASHPFSFGTPVVIEVHPTVIRIVDERGEVDWQSQRSGARLSGAGLPGVRNATDAVLTVRNAQGTPRRLAFTDPRPSVYLATTTLIIHVAIVTCFMLGVFGTGSIAVAASLITLVSVIGHAGLLGRETVPGTRQALVEAILLDRQ